MRFDSSRATAQITILVALAVVALFAGLIPLGSWRDEYYQFYFIHEQGIQATLHRLSHWSPRPLSELLIYAYAELANHYGKPFITYAIAPCWMVLVGAALLPTWRNIAALLAGSATLAMLLLGHPVSEVFYWPAAVIAYLPTVAATVAILAIDFGDGLERRSGRITIWVALFVCATCSEVGALFTAIYAPLVMAAVWRMRPRQALLLGLPWMVALAVLGAQFMGRVSVGIEILGDPALAHHPMRVIRELFVQLPYQLLKGDEHRGAVRSLATGATRKLLFLVGIYFVLSSRRGDKNPAHQHLRLALIMASLATAALTLAASYYNFGNACCERHDTMRQIYVIVALGSAASWLAIRRPARRSRAGAPLLLLALAILIAGALPKLAHDYRHYNERVLARKYTWDSGHAAAPSMQIVQAEPGAIVGGVPVPATTLHRDTPGLPGWMIRYFDKQSATVVPMKPGLKAKSYRTQPKSGGD